MEITGALEDAKEVVTKLTGAIEGGNNRMIEQVEISKRTAFLAINQAFEYFSKHGRKKKDTTVRVGGHFTVQDNSSDPPEGSSLRRWVETLVTTLIWYPRSCRPTLTMRL
eukprot:Em0491g3a